VDIWLFSASQLARGSSYLFKKFDSRDLFFEVSGD
jgi:hypothetical protein